MPGLTYRIFGFREAMSDRNLPAQFRRILRREYRDLAHYIEIYRSPSSFRQPSDNSVHRHRDVGFFPRTHFIWANTKEFFLEPEVRPGVHTVWDNGLPIDFELAAGRQDTLVVVFHPAAGADADLPIFSGHRLTSKLDCWRMSISDPTLYVDPSLTLAWYAGSSLQPDLPSIISRIIQFTKEKCGLSRIILMGSSGGGFASLMQAALNPNSTALVSNPQTDILKYQRVHVENYINIAWDHSRRAFLRSASPSVGEALNSITNLPKIFYVQNTRDHFHIDFHLKPFLAQLPDGYSLELMVGDWGGGHAPPPVSLLSEILSALLQDKTDELVKMGFKPAGPIAS